MHKISFSFSLSLIQYFPCILVNYQYIYKYRNISFKQISIRRTAKNVVSPNAKISAFGRCEKSYKETVENINMVCKKRNDNQNN